LLQERRYPEPEIELPDSEYRSIVLHSDEVDQKGRSVSVLECQLPLAPPAPPVNVAAYRLMNFMTDGSKLLSKLRGYKAISRLPLLIQPLELLNVTGLYALPIAVNCLH
jgi:hypothetical protein